MEVILFDSIFLSQTKSFKKTLGYQFVMIYNEYNNLLLVVLIYMILNGAKLGDATVARAPPLLRPPRKFIV